MSIELEGAGKGDTPRAVDKAKYDANYERVYGKREPQDFQKGGRYHIGPAEKGRTADNINFELRAEGCLPEQVDEMNKEHGHTGVRWTRDGRCIASNTTAQLDYMNATGKHLRNDIKGGPGTARRYLEKTGKLG